MTFSTLQKLTAAALFTTTAVLMASPAASSYDILAYRGGGRVNTGETVAYRATGRLNNAIAYRAAGRIENVAAYRGSEHGAPLTSLA